MNLEPLHDKLNREHPRFSAHLTFAERDAIVRTIIHSIGDVVPDVESAPRAPSSLRAQIEALRLTDGNWHPFILEGHARALDAVLALVDALPPSSGAGAHFACNHCGKSYPNGEREVCPCGGDVIEVSGAGDWRDSEAVKEARQRLDDFAYEDSFMRSYALRVKYTNALDAFADAVQSHARPSKTE